MYAVLEAHPTEGVIEMIVVSEKLSLGYAAPCAAELLFHYRGNPKSSKYNASRMHTSIEQTLKMLTKLSTSESFELQGKCVWIIYLNEIKSPIGMLTLIKKGPVIEIHFGLMQKFTGKGFASEAVSLAACYCCSSNIANEVVSFTDKENIAAQAVLVKSGFKCTGSSENYYVAPLISAEKRDVFNYIFCT